MAQSKQVLDKIARNLQILGESVSRGSNNEVIVANGSNDVTISYADASFSPAVVGGVDASASPYLGIGTGAPGKIRLRRAGAAALADVLEDAKSIKCFAVCAAFANNIVLRNAADTADLLEVRGHADLIGLGQ